MNIGWLTWHGSTAAADAACSSSCGFFIPLSVFGQKGLPSPGELCETLLQRGRLVPRLESLPAATRAAVGEALLAWESLADNRFSPIPVWLDVGGVPGISAAALTEMNPVTVVYHPK